MEDNVLFPPKDYDNSPPAVEAVNWKESVYVHFFVSVVVSDKREFRINVTKKTTISQLKKRIQKKVKERNFRLILRGKELQDDHIIGQYNIDSESTINILAKPGGCFFPNTVITLSDGFKKNIDEIKTGDIVLSYDTKNSTFQQSRVKELLKFEIVEFAELKMSSGCKISTSLMHPFWVIGKGWSVVKDESGSGISEMKIGDQFLSFDNHLETLTEVHHLSSEIPQQVFTLSLDQFHTFFANGVLVHNMQLFIKTLTGKTLIVDFTYEDEIYALKKQIEEIEGIPAQFQRLIYHGLELENHIRISEYNISKESVIHLFILPSERANEVSPIRLETYQVSTLKISIQCEDHRNQIITTSDEQVIELKRRIKGIFSISEKDPDPELIYEGRVLVDGIVSEYDIKDEDELIMIPHDKGGSVLKFMYAVASRQMSKLEELEESIIFLGRADVKKELKNIQKNISDIKSRNSHWNEYNEIGLLSIGLWTSNFFYKRCNEDLRWSQNLELWRRYLSSLVWGLRDLPPFQGKVYRGLKNFRDLSEYQIGARICWKTVSSMSKSCDIAKKYTDETGILFEVDVLSGRNITEISCYPEEEEVLLFPYSHLQVIRVQDQKGAPAYVHLREIPVPQTPKIVLWVDDHPENNQKWVRGLYQRGISVLYSINTREALQLIETYRWLLQLNEGDIRIVTDMVREEPKGGKKEINYSAGINFIKDLRNNHAFMHKVMIFCNDEEAAKKSCIEANLTENIIVTANETELENFLHFLSQESRIPSYKQSFPICSVQ